MDAKRYQHVKRLYMAAVELEKDEAAAFLQAACGDDEQLRGEVESLLAHHRPETLVADNSEAARKYQIVRPAFEGELAATPQGDTATDPPRKSIKELESIEETERFTPGTIIAGRYRILGLLGRGGMGEVFRADDLRLEQPVALKFLARSRSADEEWLERFHREVRLARRVTHANVNRVYDLGEADGEVFLSMEYVDGENLGALLRRIGRLPAERALRMAREVCAGLGAAHDQGVLHRDLKPANIMVDGLGHARITDFGIAIAKSESGTAGAAGTPAYMAPELFEGVEASVASDIYSLGVVFHEMVTGQLPLQPKVPSRDREAQSRLSSMSESVSPQMEQVIRRCLAHDPQDRPRSTYAVVAALPGGDALAAAVAAGQTPSPEMVAAAAEKPADRRLLAALFAAALVGLVAVFLLADKTMFLPRAGLEKPPAVLADRAEELLKQLGYTSPPPGRISGFAIDQGYLNFIAKNPTAARENLPGAFFWYRQGDRRLVPPPPLGGATSSRRLPLVPGMTAVQLDGPGRLLRLEVHEITPGPLSNDRSQRSVDWSIAFAAAGLELGDYSETSPIAPPPMFADEVVAWQRRDNRDTSHADRIEAAASSGRIVFFDVVLPWEKADSAASSHLLSNATGRAFVALFWLRVITILAALVLARHNLRIGRSDLRAARRLALFVFALAMLDWLVGERHSSVFQEEASAALLWTSRATFMAVVAWLTYVAVEPYVRRFWPQTIITWSRMIAGRFRDPLVGRDLLAGTVFGLALTVLSQTDVLLGQVLPRGALVARLPGGSYDLGELLGLRYKMGTVVTEVLEAVSLAMFMLLLLLVLRIAFRGGRSSVIAFALIVTVVYGVWADIDTSLPWALGLVTGIAVVLVLTRVGFVALAVGLFVQAVLMANPLTLHWDAWYAPAAIFAGLVPLALASYGFYAARP